MESLNRVWISLTWLLKVRDVVLLRRRADGERDQEENLMNRMTAAAVIAALTVAAPVLGDYTITQGSSAPTYGTVLTFDEPGDATGSIASNAYASYGINELISGTGAAFVGDNTAGQPWVGTGNSVGGAFGLFMMFDEDLTEMSFQAWDPSGAPSPFGGGMGVVLFNDGVEVSFTVYEPAWGGIGDEWYDITTTGGMVFDEVRVLGFGNPGPTTYMDNMSWNTVPAPGALALLAVGGMLGRRRRD
jgi:hypothetical protein